jgi:putative ABC transport system permease protein
MRSVASQTWRSWKSAKAVGLLAALAFAAGIGSTTAIYTVVNTVLLKPLPYKQGERFVALYGATFSEPKQRSSLTYPDVLAYQQRTHSFEAFGWFKVGDYNLTSPGQPQHIQGIEVTPSLVRSLGVSPAIGRWFGDSAGKTAGVYVAVISHALWNRLGADPRISGQALTLNGKRYSIAGVMPAWFRLPVGAPGAEQVRSDVWIPLDPRSEAQDRTLGVYFAYGRLKPGMTLAAAEVDVKRVAAQIAKEDPAGHPSYTARLDNLREIVVSEIRPTLLLLFGAAALLLLITCANVSGLLVARSVERARETAVRLALGATPWQLSFQYLSEGLLVSLIGAAAGVFISLALVHLVISLASEYIPRADEITVDWTIFLFAFVLACLASILASIAPLWQAVRTQPNEVLNDGVRASAGARSRKLSSSLVVAEIALAFTLLAVSAILITQLRNLTRTPSGFNPSHLLTFEITAADSQYPNVAKLLPYQKRLIQALEASPGITSAALVNQLPLAGCCYSTTIFPEGRTIDSRAVQRISFVVVTPEYFPSMQLPLRSGRLLDERDTSENPLNVLINQAAARYYWPNREPVGGYGHVGGANGSRFQVVGVVGDVRNDGLDKPTVPEIYLSSGLVAVNPMHFIVRSPLPESTLLPEIRQAVQRVDPAQPVHSFAAMTEVVEGSLSLQRVSSFMTGFFAMAALLLAGLGVYGVVAYSVRQRTVEIGTRIALGASGQDVVTLVVGGGIRMAGWGIAIGAAGTAAATWLLIRDFGIHGIGSRPFVYSVAVIAAISVLASLFPAWRATLLSPMVAIRNEPGSMWEAARRGVREVLGGISHLLPGGEDPAIPEGQLLAEFVDASRRAESYPEALHMSLARLCDVIGCESAMLLEKDSTEQYSTAAAVPALGKETLVLSADGFLLGRLRFHTGPLPMTPGDFETWLRWASEQRPNHIAELEVLRRTGARLALGVRAKKEIAGIVLLGAPTGRNEYSAIDKRVLRACAAQFALMIENARLTHRVLEQEKLRRDLALAAEVQRRLLPESTPETGLGTPRGRECSRADCGRRLLRFPEGGRTSNRNRPCRRRRKGCCGRPHHISGTRIVAHHCKRRKCSPAGACGENESFPVSLHTIQQLRDFFLCAGGRRESRTALCERRTQSAVSSAPVGPGV